MLSVMLSSIIMGLIGQKEKGEEIVKISIIGTIISIYKWMEEIKIESNYQGEHNKQVEKGIKIGLNLVIISEVIIFISLIYSYLYNNLISSVEIGNI